MFSQVEQSIFNKELPLKTNTYTPVSHKSVITNIIQTLHDSGLEVSKKIYNESNNYDVITGTYLIEGKNNDFKRSLSFINSYNKKRKLGLVSGLSTMVCLNGCVSGDYKYQQKHQGDVNKQLQHEISLQIQNIDTEYEKLITWLNKLKLVTLTRKEMAELAGRMFIEEEILRTPQLNILKKEIIKPSFDYGGNSDEFYSFYQNCTCALKNAHPMESTKQHVQVYEFINNVIGN